MVVSEATVSPSSSDSAPSVAESGYKSYSSSSSATSFASSTAATSSSSDASASEAAKDKGGEDEEDEDSWEYCSDEEEEEEEEKVVVEAKKKPAANLSSFGIPASLLTRWDYTIWDSDSDEEDEDEDEELEELSPLNSQPARDDKVNLEAARSIKDWLSSMGDDQVYQVKTNSDESK